LRGTPGVHTPGAPLVLEAIPGLPWQLNNAASIIDTLAQLRPRPASEFRFFNASFSFQGGGTLVAVGEAAKVIRFRPLDGSSGNFHGLQFQNPGPDVNPANNPTAVSTLTYVRLDSASGAAFPTGGICHNSCVAAINAGDRHRLLIDNARIHKAWSGAIYAATPLTTITNSLIDTTGTVASGYVANSAAVALNDSVSMSNVVVHRSGHTGIHLDGDAITIVGVRVSQSRGIGIQVANNSASTGSQGLQLSGFAVDSAGGVGVSIEATDVRLSDCDVLNGMSHGLATSTSLTGVRINDCNIENNGRSGTGLGVSNFNVGPTPPNSFEIDANNNFWGSGAPPVLDAINGISLNVGVSSVRTARIIH
jgi:hypothetical protein